MQITSIVTFILQQKKHVHSSYLFSPQKKVPQNTKKPGLWWTTTRPKVRRGLRAVWPNWGAKGCSELKTWSKHGWLELVWLFGCFVWLSVPGITVIHTRVTISEVSKLFLFLDVYHCGRFRLISVVWLILRLESMMACLLMFAKF